jgi:hypothetical protein
MMILESSYFAVGLQLRILYVKESWCLELDCPSERVLLLSTLSLKVVTRVTLVDRDMFTATAIVISVGNVV